MEKKASLNSENVSKQLNSASWVSVKVQACLCDRAWHAQNDTIKVNFPYGHCRIELRMPCFCWWAHHCDCIFWIIDSMKRLKRLPTEHSTISF